MDMNDPVGVSRCSCTRVRTLHTILKMNYFTPLSLCIPLPSLTGQKDRQRIGWLDNKTTCPKSGRVFTDKILNFRLGAPFPISKHASFPSVTRLIPMHTLTFCSSQALCRHTNGFLCLYMFSRPIYLSSLGVILI